MSHKQNHKTLLILFLTMISLTSCSVENKIGKTFIQNHPPIQIVLSPTNLLFKYNHKGEAIENFDSLNTSQQDSALYASSRFMREIDDSVFLDTYINSFMDELRKLGFPVYISTGEDSLLKDNPQVYYLRMAQLQLDEYFYPLQDEMEMEEMVYIKNINLNAIDFSAWYEINKMFSPNVQKTVLYATHTMTDGFDGSFTSDPFTDAVRYRYKVDSITMPDVMVMASNLGKRHASYLYDFFLNQYIAYKMPEGQAPYWYFHYNRFSKSLEIVEDDQFQILEQE
ncbi:MAG TPA: hypothetical protein PLD52_09685 [Bacteroidales bacterium]|nr:hypothetical protein [Bacteroidales bacterium]